MIVIRQENISNIKEKQLTKKFKDNWKGYFERIEPKYKGGIPDSLLVNDFDYNLFLEFKVGSWTKTKGTLVIKVRPSQKIWFRKYPLDNAYLLAEIDSIYYLFPKDNVCLLKCGILKEKLEKMAVLYTGDFLQIIQFLDLVS